MACVYAPTDVQFGLNLAAYEATVMHRTIESIVENHRVASARRAAGKPIWDRNIDIKGILRVDPGNTSNEHAAAVANRIGDLIRSRVAAAWLDYNSPAFDEDLLDIVEGMEALKPDSYDGDEEMTPIADLNGMLGQLYDWADTKRVWLGL